MQNIEQILNHVFIVAKIMQPFLTKWTTTPITKSVSEIYYLCNDKFDKIGQVFVAKAIKFQSKF